MQWANKLFGYGLLDPELEKRLSEQQKMQMGNASMMDAGLAMLANSGYSRVPTTLGQSLAEGVGAGRASYAAQAQGLAQQSEQEAKRQAEIQQQRQWQQYLQTLPPEQAQLFMALGQNEGQQALSKIAVERSKPQKSESRTSLQKEAEQLYPGNATQQALWIREQRAKPTGTTVNVGTSTAPSDPLSRIVTPEQRAMLAQQGVQLADGTEYAWDKNNIPQPIKGTAPSERQSGGMNERQRAGLNIKRDNIIEYAAQLTGVPPAELSGLSPAEVRAVVEQRGARVLQGPVLGDLPYVSEAANRDITSWQGAAASGQAGINNPTGAITESDFEIARKQLPGPQMPLEVQARMIEKALEEAEQGGKDEPVSAPRILRRVR